MGKRVLRIAGWCSAIFFLVFGTYFEIMALAVLSMRPRNAAEWVPMVYHSLVPIGYGISVLWRLKVPAKEPAPQVAGYIDAEAEAANSAELAEIIQRLANPEIDRSRPENE